MLHEYKKSKLLPSGLGELWIIWLMLNSYMEWVVYLCVFLKGCLAYFRKSNLNVENKQRRGKYDREYYYFSTCTLSFFITGPQLQVEIRDLERWSDLTIQARLANLWILNLICASCFHTSFYHSLWGSIIQVNWNQTEGPMLMYSRHYFYTLNCSKASYSGWT